MLLAQHKVPGKGVRRVHAFLFISGLSAPHTVICVSSFLPFPITHIYIFLSFKRRPHQRVGFHALDVLLRGEAAW
jgi:hypothetical protein